MSRTFYIKNTQAPEVMSPQQLLDLQSKGFVQYNLTEDDERYHQVMNTPISEWGYMIMGQEGISGRGFEVSYDTETQDYGVRIFTPSTEADWLGAIEFIGKVATALGSKVVDEEGEVYEPNDINYNYKGDIEFGVRAYKDTTEGAYIFTVYRPVCLSPEMIQEILTKEDKIKAFSELVEKQLYQYPDAYIARQQFFRNDKGEVMGAYALTEGVPTILPYEYPPFIDFSQIDLNQDDIKLWRISLVVINGDENDPDAYEVLDGLDYQTFLNRLPEDKIQKLDGHYMLLQLNRKELEALLQNDKQERKGFLAKLKNLLTTK
ncbi:hypothetical protein RCZ04_10760 [Capnocytophaga sp. HP1101]